MEAIPDLVSLLSAGERAQVERIAVPVLRVRKGSVSVPALLKPARAFAAIVIEGLVLHNFAAQAGPGARILGPGDIIMPARQPRRALPASPQYAVRELTGLALLGTDFLEATRRVPRMVVGLEAVAAEQIDRLSAQLAICQLPRVADRVLAMMWLLAESYGRVTPGGTTMPLSLTHEILGKLVGARRPTITLAHGELTDRRAIVHQELGWLLLEAALV